MAISFLMKRHPKILQTPLHHALFVLCPLSNGATTLFASLLLLTHLGESFLLLSCLVFAICETLFFFFLISSNDTLLMQLYRVYCRFYCLSAQLSAYLHLGFLPKTLPNCSLTLLKSGLLGFFKTRFSFCHT